MIAVAQIINSGSVSIVGQEENSNSVGRGFVVFLGVSNTDTTKDLEKVVSKLLKLRVFDDDNGKMNLDIKAISGEILLISQFTLLGELKGNNRPDFTRAAGKVPANDLYQIFTAKLREAGITTKQGFFGEHMLIDAKLCGPVTIIIDSAKI